MNLSMMLWLFGCSGCPGADEAVTPVPSPSERGVASSSSTFEVVRPSERAERWSGALCNDGTPFALEMRHQGSDVWVVSFSGGYFCDDVSVPCDRRARRLTTTLPLADGQLRAGAREGIFSRNPSKNPGFHSANHVDLHYCSSDLWLGEHPERQPTSAAKDGWYFRGRSNARAGLEYLKVAGLEDTHKVLLIGYSAGGLGLVGNMDAVLEVFEEQRRRDNLKLVMDGSWIPIWSTENMPKANRWGSTHAECEAHERAAGNAPERCVFGPLWWPYVEATGVPILVQISGQDTTQLPAFGVVDPLEKRRWSAAVRSSLEPIPWVFSGARPYHVLTHNQRFGKATQGRPSFESVVSSFWKGEAPRQVLFGYP